MQMTGLTEQHKQLAIMAGDWAGEEKVHPSPWDPQGGTATSRYVARLELNSFYLITEYEQSRGGQVCYRAHGVYGYDPQKQKFLMYWFDGMGCDMGGPALGVWEGDRLQFTHQSAQGHGRYTYRFVSATELMFTLEHSGDGKNWTLFLESRFRKRG